MYYPRARKKGGHQAPSRPPFYNQRIPAYVLETDVFALPPHTSTSSSVPSISLASPPAYNTKNAQEVPLCLTAPPRMLFVAHKRVLKTADVLPVRHERGEHHSAGSLRLHGRAQRREHRASGSGDGHHVHGGRSHCGGGRGHGLRAGGEVRCCCCVWFLLFLSRFGVVIGCSFWYFFCYGWGTVAVDKKLSDWCCRRRGRRGRPPPSGRCRCCRFVRHFYPEKDRKAPLPHMEAVAAPTEKRRLCLRCWVGDMPLLHFVRCWVLG